tara:strand:- start:897 stop:1313 length:417 start_codon:yes stop_codon:yes gene_type:complete
MSAAFLTHFDSISDPRIERCKKYNLMDILLLSISAVMSSSEGWKDIENFGHIKLDWLHQYGSFEASIPRHGTIARVICRLKMMKLSKPFSLRYLHLSKILAVMSLPLTIKRHAIHFLPKIENVLCIPLVSGAVSISWF